MPRLLSRRKEGLGDHGHGMGALAATSPDSFMAGHSCLQALLIVECFCISDRMCQRLSGPHGCVRRFLLSFSVKPVVKGLQSCAVLAHCGRQTCGSSCSLPYAPLCFYSSWPAVPHSAVARSSGSPQQHNLLAGDDAWLVWPVSRGGTKIHCGFIYCNPHFPGLRKGGLPCSFVAGCTINFVCVHEIHTCYFAKMVVNRWLQTPRLVFVCCNNKHEVSFAALYLVGSGT